MRTLAFQRILSSLLAAIASGAAAMSALPKNPASVPWPEWVSWSALAMALVALLVWFLVGSWAMSRIREIAGKVRRRALYGLVFVLLCLAPLGPLLLAYIVYGMCRLGAPCGANLEGFFQVLFQVPFELNFSIVLLVALMLCVVERHVFSGAAPT